MTIVFDDDKSAPKSKIVFDDQPAKKEPPPILPSGQRDYSVLENVVGGIAEPIASMATGFAARPVSQVMGMSAAAAGKEDPVGFQREAQREMTYEPRTPAGRSQYNPLNLIPGLIGRGVNWAGEQLGGIVAPPGSGPVREAVGRGVTEAAEQAPGFIGIKAPVAAAAGKAALREGAESMMQRALKPSEEAQRTGRADRAIDVMLDKGINVSKGGIEKMQNRVDYLNDRIKEAIGQSTATVNKDVVASRLLGTFDKFRKQVDSSADLAAIEKSWNNFLDNPLIAGRDEIPVQLAQQMKQGTYKQLKNRAYGELKSADIEAQKTLARGLKDEIAKAVPQVRQLNAEESRMLDALSLTEKRMMREANKNPIGLGWLTTNKLHFAAWIADRSPLFKSLVARMLNRTGEALPGMARYAPLGGMAVTQQATGIPPPPQ